MELSKTGADFANVLDIDVIIALLDSNDDIGVVLRIHFLLENLLELWCSKITGYENFFDFDDRISFSMKLKFAKKLEINPEVASFIKIFNRFRNDMAHFKGSIISDDILDKLRHALNRIPSFGEKKIPKIEDPEWVGEFDNRAISWSDPNISNKDKLMLIYFTFCMKVISVFINDLSEKGISISYAQ